MKKTSLLSEKERKEADAILKVEGHGVNIDYDVVDHPIEDFIFNNIITIKIIICLLSIIIFYLFIFIRGNILVKSIANIEYCSDMYFIVYSLGMVLQLKVVIFISYILIRESRIKHSIENVSSGRIKYTALNCFQLFLIGSFIGFGSILFGLAGGSIVNPMLLYLGFDPLHAVATGVSIMEITLSGTITNYGINGFIDVPYVLFVGILALFTTIIGLLVLNLVLDKFQRTSFLSFFMGCIFVISFCLAINSIVKTLQMKGHNHFNFKDYCKISSYLNRTHDI